MADKIKFTIDGKEIQAERGQTIMQAADAAGIYIPRLCWAKALSPTGACRVCTVKVNGRYQASCTQPVADEMVVENETAEVMDKRNNIIEMLFAEGNHYCPFCETSGNCELQAMAYRFGITAPKYQYQFPKRDVDASHPDILLDRNRCILCGRCVKTAKAIDGKTVFGFVGRGKETRLAVNARARLKDTDIDLTDKCVEACPVGAILKKRTAYAVPVGERTFDGQPIGSDIDRAKKGAAK